jgi:hypothetical protein
LMRRYCCIIGVCGARGASFMVREGYPKTRCRAAPGERATAAAGHARWRYLRGPPLG